VRGSPAQRSCSDHVVGVRLRDAPTAATRPQAALWAACQPCVRTCRARAGCVAPVMTNQPRAHLPRRPDAEPWRVQFFRCGYEAVSGWPGWRAVVTTPGGSKAWADLPITGPEAFLQDYATGGAWLLVCARVRALLVCVCVCGGGGGTWSAVCLSVASPRHAANHGIACCAVADSYCAVLLYTRAPHTPLQWAWSRCGRPSACPARQRCQRCWASTRPSSR
jgi:hypothetical protein